MEFFALQLCGLISLRKDNNLQPNKMDVKMPSQRPFDTFFAALSEGTACKKSYDARQVTESDTAGKVEFLVISDPDNDSEVMRGEFYPEQYWDQPLCVLRWPVACMAQTFFATMQQMLNAPDEMPSSPIEVHVLQSGKAYPEPGLFLYTGDDIFHIPLSVLPALAKGAKGLEDLEAAVNATGHRSWKSSISAVRIGTDGGDFQLDVLPDSDGDRNIAVLTRCDLSREIAYLRNATGTSTVEPAGLNATVQQITQVLSRSSAVPETGLTA